SRNRPLAASLALHSNTVSAGALSSMISLSDHDGDTIISWVAPSKIAAFSTPTVAVAFASAAVLSLHLAAENFTLTSAQPLIGVNFGVAIYPAVLPAVLILT